MVKLILLFLAVPLAVILILAAFKPRVFSVQRSVGILAKPEQVFFRIGDFRRWESWSPWEKLDPDMKRRFSGAATGTGAVYEWEGNKKVGRGRMEITESTAPERIVIRLDFLKPFKSQNTCEFSLSGKNDTTQVTWFMQGPSPYFMRIMHLFLNMDALVGKDFEKGLADLKAVCEKSP